MITASDVEIERLSTRKDLDQLLTPALAIYPEVVRHNINRTVSLLGGDPNRWRPHVKTVKLAAMIRLLPAAGINSVKCATTLELLVSCEAGAKDVLVAYAHTGANAKRIAEIATAHPAVQVS